MDIEPLAGAENHPAWLLQERFTFLKSLSAKQVGVEDPAIESSGDEADGESPDAFGRGESGGYGEVYMVRSRFGGELGALKIVRPKITDDVRKQLAEGMLVREARLLRHLRHPNIVRLVADCAHGDDVLPYLLLEYVPGPSLEVFLDLGQSSLIRLRLALGITSAIVHMHRHDQFHNDLHPGNVVVDERAKWPVLIDFGLTTQSGPADETLTGLGRRGWIHEDVMEQLPFSRKTECFQLAKIVAFTLGDLELDAGTDQGLHDELRAVLGALESGESEDVQSLCDAVNRCLLDAVAHQIP